MKLFSKVIPNYVLGLVLLVPSAALMVACWACPCVWVWKRWKRNPLPCESVKRVRQNVSVEFVIPESVVGYVIGRRGASVRAVEEESGARIQFKDQQGSKDKMVVITGRAGCVASARELIQSAVDERLTAHRNQQTLTLTLPQRAVGKVIGRQGANIRSIQRESGAKVTMLTGGRSDAVRLCEVVGSPEQLSRAVSLIQEQVAANNKRPLPKQQEPTTFDLQPLTLTPSSEFVPVFVSAVDGHGGVWVQPIAQEDPQQLESLVHDMTCYYGNSEKSYYGNVHVGDVFAAPFEYDDKWYRVRVTAVDGVRRVEVVYVDYGDYGPVDLEELRTLQPQFRALKEQAVRCLLDKVIPTGGVWQEDGLESLELLTHSSAWKVIMAKITTSDPYPRVQLVDTSSDKDIDVAEQLVATGHAQWVRSHPPYPYTLSSHGNHPLLSVPNCVPLTDQSEVSVSFVQSPDLLFVIPTGYELLLSQLCERMNTLFDQSNESLSSIKIGDMVAANTPLNKQWYRGHVISFNESDLSAIVRLVDYGVLFHLPLSQLRPLSPTLITEEVWCVPVSLANVSPAGGVWTDEGSQFLREATDQGDWSPFIVKLTGFHSNKDGISLPAVILESNKGVSVNSNLVASGLAEEIKGCDNGLRQKNVKFRWSGADNVSVAGSFNQWKEKELKRGNNGEFEATFDLPPGTHEYKYVVDGAWTHDHSQPTTYNNYGTLNNIITT